MNRFRHLLLLALLGLITACSYNELPENLSPLTIENDGLVLQVETRAETYKGQSLDQEYFVTAADLENFVKYRRIASKRSDLTVKEVKSYGFDSSQTLLYILNYDQGWEVVSADKRVQPTLAHGDSGEFTMDSDNEAMKFWMNMIADGVLQMRLGNVESEVATASTESKDSADEPTSDHTAFWDAISPTNSSRTRFEPLTPIPGPVAPPDGIYRYEIDCEVASTLTEELPELLDTEWGQSYPWNQYCPLIHADSTQRAPAGCLPVAGAQLLYFLATEKGWPLKSPGYAACTGTIDSYSVIFGSFNTYIWNSMAPKWEYNTDYMSMLHVAKLIAYVGDIIDVTYGANSSTAVYNTFLQNMQHSFAMSIQRENTFSKATIMASLRDGMPVIVAANAPGAPSGHMWIIDGYKIYNKVLTHYVATFDTYQTPEYLATLDKDDADYSYTTTFNYVEFHMNWGWSGGQNRYFNSEPIAWTVNTDEGTTTYSELFYILYGYSKN